MSDLGGAKDTVTGPFKGEIDQILQKIFEKAGFEHHPFKIGWYNEKVDHVYKLPCHEDTLAYLIISTPSMFDKAFKPFLHHDACIGVRDPIDECMAHHFKQVKQSFPNNEIEVLHDYELDHNRRPKVLVQTAGHVAGAAYYYQRSDVVNDPWKEKQRIFGVSIHPKYGGWFGMRGVIVFKDVLVPDMERKHPPNLLTTDQQKIDLLERFNYHWQDWTYRDVIPTVDKYSEEQKLYFATKPKERAEILKKIMERNTDEKPSTSSSVT